MNTPADKLITVIVQEAAPADVAPLERDYLPHAIAGDPLNPTGAFTAG